jgi:hypothetical protein
MLESVYLFAGLGRRRAKTFANVVYAGEIDVSSVRMREGVCAMRMQPNNTQEIGFTTRSGISVNRNFLQRLKNRQSCTD